MDLSQFGKGNYLTSPHAVVGVARHKNYFTNKPRSNSTGAFFHDRRSGGNSKGVKEDAKKRYKIMKEMLANEKKANKLLDSEIKSLTENLQ